MGYPSQGLYNKTKIPMIPRYLVTKLVQDQRGEMKGLLNKAQKQS
jgi:hypothetical protein